MRIKFYFFGKKNEITDLEQKLIQRIGFRCSLDIFPLSQAGIKEPEKAKAKEAELFFSKIEDRDFIVALDEHGKEYNSPAFSVWLKNRLIEETTVCFVMGGAHGLHKTILSRAQQKIQFGKMVWTRNLCRHMAFEQIYRALEIDGGSNFHKK